MYFISGSCLAAPTFLDRLSSALTSLNGGCVDLLGHISSPASSVIQTWKLSQREVDDILDIDNTTNTWRRYFFDQSPLVSGLYESVVDLLSEEERELLASILTRGDSQDGLNEAAIMRQVLEAFSHEDIFSIDERLLDIQKHVFIRDEELALRVQHILARQESFNLDLYTSRGLTRQAFVHAYNSYTGITSIRYNNIEMQIPLGDLYELATESSIMREGLPIIQQWNNSEFSDEANFLTWQVLSENSHFVDLRANDNLAHTSLEAQSLYNLVTLQRGHLSAGARLGQVGLEQSRRYDLRHQVLNFPLLETLGFDYSEAEDTLHVPSLFDLNTRLFLRSPFLANVRFEHSFARSSIDPILYARKRAQGLYIVGIGSLKQNFYEKTLLPALSLPREIDDLIQNKYRFLVELYDDPVLRENESFSDMILSLIEKMQLQEKHLKFDYFLWHEFSEVENHYITPRDIEEVVQRLTSLSKSVEFFMDQHFRQRGRYFTFHRSYHGDAIRRGRLTGRQLRRYRQLMRRVSREGLREGQILGILSSEEYHLALGHR